MRIKKQLTVASKGSRLDQLNNLKRVLADQITCIQMGLTDEDLSRKDLPKISKEYRETLREIDELNGTGGADDEIAGILSEREADGKSGSVRKNRT